MPTSANGWSANDISQTQNYTIGNGRTVRLRKGDAGYLLKTWADWFDANIEDIDKGADDWGYAERTIRGSSTTLSNHASGTALDLNATKHPLGVRGTFTPAQISKIRTHLKNFDGAIRWGGDYQNRPDEMHFEINTDMAGVARVATKIRAAAAKEKLATAPPVTPRVAGMFAQIQSLANQILEATSSGTPNYRAAWQIRGLAQERTEEK